MVLLLPEYGGGQMERGYPYLKYAKFNFMYDNNVRMDNLIYLK